MDDSFIEYGFLSPSFVQSIFAWLDVLHDPRLRTVPGQAVFKIVGSNETYSLQRLEGPRQTRRLKPCVMVMSAATMASRTQTLPSPLMLLTLPLILSEN